MGNEYHVKLAVEIGEAYNYGITENSWPEGFNRSLYNEVI